MEPTLKDMKKHLTSQPGFDYPQEEEVSEDTLAELTDNKGDDEDE